MTRAGNSSRGLKAPPRSLALSAAPGLECGSLGSQIHQIPQDRCRPRCPPRYHPLAAAVLPGTIVSKMRLIMPATSDSSPIDLPYDEVAAAMSRDL